MYMKRTKSFVIAVIIILSINMSYEILARAKKSISFLSPKSFYLFIENGYLGINPYNLYNYDNMDWESTFIYGAGFTLLNIHNRYKVNFEFDFINPNFTVYDNGVYNQSINFYNYKINVEYIFGRRRFSTFSGIGISNIKYLGNTKKYNHSFTTVLFESGLKFFISKHICLRGEIKIFSNPDTSYYYDFDYDYFDYDIQDVPPVALAFALGLEFKF